MSISSRIDLFRASKTIFCACLLALVVPLGCSDDSDESESDSGIQQQQDAEHSGDVADADEEDIDEEDADSRPDVEQDQDGDGESDTLSDPDAADSDAADPDAADPDAADPDAADPDTASPPEGCPSDATGFSITQVNGDLEDGAELVVCGAGFGAQGPEAVFFENFESGTAGEDVTESSPVRGSWLSPSGHYVDDGSRSGGLSLLVADADETGGGGVGAVMGFPDEQGDFGLMHFDQFFVSWAERDLGDYPGNDSGPTTFSSDSSAKDIWVMYGDRGDNYDYSCSQGECNGNDIVLATHTGGGNFKTDGNTTGSDWWMQDFWAFQQWNMMSVFLSIDSQAPYGPVDAGVFEHFSADAPMHREEYDGAIMREELDEIPPVWDRIKFGAWYRKAGDVRRIMDDLYVAVGDGAPARVEIANAENIENATRIAISPVDGWSDGRIDATVNLGGFDPAQEDLFLFVVDANNQRSGGFALGQ